MSHKRTISELMMDVLGSWPVFFLVLTATNVPALWDLWHHKSTERLDLNISIWTLQLDMVFLIGQNYTRKADRKLIRQLHDKNDTLTAALRELHAKVDRFFAREKRDG